MNPSVGPGEVTVDTFETVIDSIWIFAAYDPVAVAWAPKPGSELNQKTPLAVSIFNCAAQNVLFEKTVLSSFSKACAAAKLMADASDD